MAIVFTAGTEAGNSLSRWADMAWSPAEASSHTSTSARREWLTEQNFPFFHKKVFLGTALFKKELLIEEKM